MATDPVGEIPKEHRPYCACYDCGRRYGEEFGFPDLMVPHEVWKRVGPTGTDAGLLCPSCLARRCTLAGIRTTVVWGSGPFSPPGEVVVPQGYTLMPQTGRD